MDITNSASDEVPALSFIKPLLLNLLEILKQEQEHLNTGNLERHEVFAKRKMQALAQLNQFTKNGLARELASVIEGELRQIKELLKDNLQKLEFRKNAIDEIAHTIESAMNESNSDGTYQAGNYKVSARS